MKKAFASFVHVITDPAATREPARIVAAGTLTSSAPENERRRYVEMWATSKIDGAVRTMPAHMREEHRA